MKPAAPVARTIVEKVTKQRYASNPVFWGSLPGALVGLQGSFSHESVLALVVRSTRLLLVAALSNYALLANNPASNRITGITDHRR